MPRRCKQCKNEIPKVADSNYLERLGFCNDRCACAYGLEQARKKREQKAEREVKRKSQGKPRKESSQTELTQSVFNRMIRILDAGKDCVSCGRYQCGAFWDAGHKRSVASCPELRFDPRNCHLQGSACNRANRRPDKKQKRGVETIAQEYDQRLRERYSDELVDWLNGPHEMPRWRDDELKALRAVFAAECRRLERGEGPSRDWRAMDYEVRDLISDK